MGLGDDQGVLVDAILPPRPFARMWKECMGLTSTDSLSYADFLRAFAPNARGGGAAADEVRDLSLEEQVALLRACVKDLSRQGGSPEGKEMKARARRAMLRSEKRVFSHF